MLATLVRKAYLRAAKKRSTHITATVGGVVYLVSTRDEGPGRAVALHGLVPEFDTLPRALSILDAHRASRGREVMVEVGANIGTTALPALLRFGFARALAIEPEEENVRVLAANAALNGVSERIDLVAAAASDVPGEAFFRPGRASQRGWQAGAGALRAEGGNGSRLVPVTTVDHELQAHAIPPEAVGLLWIDAQGHEAHVLEGAQSLLDCATPVVFAFRRGKLAKAARIDSIVDAVRTRYTDVIDLRAPGREPTPSASFPELVERKRTTDVLAFRRR